MPRREALSGEETVTAAVLVIGDEILSGRTPDRNINYIAAHMTSIGIRLREVRVVADDEREIVDAVNALRARYTYLITTGGIGPTHDDITADAIAKALGVPIDHDPRAVELLEAYFVRRGVTSTPARMRMARIPHGAELIANPVSVAPGFMIDNVIVLAGVPDVMQVMLDDVTARLRTGAKMLTETIKLSRPEGDVADLFAAHQQAFPDVAMGSYPSFADGRISTQLVLRSTDSEMLERARQGLMAQLNSRGMV
ncbi:competence/damage-inducible protein A [Hyphomicrobium sulfonivorans]|uniref:competence/damage-inducible protein A n=1 Tax=Hyphomicrobium sulfonivorans TaxID=121290 RepID=UPI000839626C|nr:molybdopterin-binding protein [Hyphomicrobium sulfonivorans]